MLAAVLDLPLNRAVIIRQLETTELSVLADSHCNVDSEVVEVDSWRDKSKNGASYIALKLAAIHPVSAMMRCVSFLPKVQ